MSHLDRVDLDGVELEYELRGAGDAVVLVHAGVCADFFEPLREEPALADRHRLLRYHRVGYAGSGSVDGSVSIADQAAHCGVLMRHLGVGRAHVVGHSSSAMIALQLALDAPDLVHTLALLDAARPAPRTDLQEAFVETVVQVAVRQYRTGDKAGAVDAWMRGVCGPDYASSLEKTLPGAFEQAVDDADACFGQELPAVQAWAFSREDASRVVQPASSSWGNEATRSSASGQSCCSPGCPRPNASPSQARPTSSRWRTPARWRRASPPSSPVTRCRADAHPWRSRGFARDASRAATA